MTTVAVSRRPEAPTSFWLDSPNVKSHSLALFIGTAYAFMPHGDIAVLLCVPQGYPWPLGPILSPKEQAGSPSHSSWSRE